MGIATVEMCLGGGDGKTRLFHRARRRACSAGTASRDLEPGRMARGAMEICLEPSPEFPLGLHPGAFTRSQSLCAKYHVFFWIHITSTRTTNGPRVCLASASYTNTNLLLYTLHYQACIKHKFPETSVSYRPCQLAYALRGWHHCLGIANVGTGLVMTATLQRSLDAASLVASRWDGTKRKQMLEKQRCVLRSGGG